MQRILGAFHRAVVFLLHVERRFEPFFRPAFNAVLREPMAKLIQWLINRRRRDEGLALAEERIQPDEEKHLQSIIDTMTRLHAHAPLPAGRIRARRQHQDAWHRARRA